MYKFGWLSGRQLMPHNCELELIEECNLWQLSFQSEESLQNNQKPEQIFILESIYLIQTGKTKDGLQFVQFIFRQAEAEHIFFKFPHQADYNQFMDKVKHIIRFHWQKAPYQYMIEQDLKSDIELENLLLSNSHFDWLNSEQSSIINQLSSQMRQNHVSLSVDKLFSIEQDETLVNWMSTVNIDG